MTRRAGIGTAGETPAGRSGSDGVAAAARAPNCSPRVGRLRLVGVGLVLQFAMISTCFGEEPGQDRARSPREPGAEQPFELVRTLESVQDQVVLGNSDAQAKLPKLLGQIATRILAAAPKAWEDPRNLRAVIVYASSGGQARVLRAVADLGVARAEMKDLLDGIIAYLEGRDTRAKQILLPIDAMTMSVPLAGRIAIIQSNLVANEDPQKAMQLLARARVLAAGTLVEEAALRKEIFLADQVDDLDSFVSLSGQYIRRFDRSAYAANFRQRFRAAIMRFGLTSDPARFATVETALGVLAPDEQLQLLLGMARAGLLAGAIEPARHAAEKAVGLAKDGTAEASRATLYTAVTHVLSGEIDAGIRELQSLETVRLTKPDVELGKAVLAMASDVSAQVSESRPIGAEPAPSNGARPEGRERGASGAAAALIEQAETVLDEVGGLLQRKGL